MLYFSIPSDALFTSAAPEVKAVGFASCSSGEEPGRWTDMQEINPYYWSVEGKE